MGAVIWKMGCPRQLHEDALQDAFVLALCKPISQRPSIEKWERFVAWMCACAMYAYLTNRNTVERRRESYEFSDEEIAELLVSRADIPDPGLQKALKDALTSLNSEDQDLLYPFLFDEKTVKEIADKRRLPWSTTKDRLERVLGLVRACLQSFIVAIVLVVAKNARAQGTRLARHTYRNFSRMPRKWQAR